MSHSAHSFAQQQAAWRPLSCCLRKLSHSSAIRVNMVYNVFYLVLLCSAACSLFALGILSVYDLTTGILLLFALIQMSPSSYSEMCAYTLPTATGTEASPQHMDVRKILFTRERYLQVVACLILCVVGRCAIPNFRQSTHACRSKSGICLHAALIHPCVLA